MAISPSDIRQILGWLAKERESYNYLPKGFPVDRNDNRIPRGWNNLSLVNLNYNDTARRSQSLLKAICARMSHAGTPEDKADAVLLVRFWKTHRRARRFAGHYCPRMPTLVEMWEKAKQIASHDANIRDLEQAEIKIPTASALVTAISPTRRFGILDTVLASVWKKKGWIDFDIREQGLYLMPRPSNWNYYSEYISDLATICNGANVGHLRFTDPLTGNRTVFTVHDVEMALFHHYQKRPPSSTEGGAVRLYPPEYPDRRSA